MSDVNSPNWQRLRSDIYVRDKGICWICNGFANLDDYDLGHLVDRCNGGHDDYDNLAVMHRSCNLSKPKHINLEDAMKWKLTRNINNVVVSTRIIPYKQRRVTQYIDQPNYKLIHVPTNQPERRSKLPSRRTIIIKERLYQEQCAKIKPATLCWVQGRPMGGPMWRVLPPPYRKEDMFIMRRDPPGATDVINDGSLEETLQVIGGDLPQNTDINIDIGYMRFHISSTNGEPIITCETGTNTNTGERKQTIGMGKGQIPIAAWLEAKKQGLSMADFKTQYLNPNNPRDVPVSA